MLQALCRVKYVCLASMLKDAQSIGPNHRCIAVQKTKLSKLKVRARACVCCAKRNLAPSAALHVIRRFIDCINPSGGARADFLYAFRALGHFRGLGFRAF